MKNLLKTIALICVFSTSFVNVFTQSPTGSKALTNIAVLYPAKDQFSVAFEAMKSELASRYALISINISEDQKIEEISALCKKSNVSALVLMDSKAVAKAKELQNSDSFFVSLPKFVLMTLSAQVETKGLTNASGIAFEVPGYTLITNFKIISQIDFSNVLVFYRSTVSSSNIEDAKKALAKEQITLDAICVDC
jgi:hypothetical protein